MLQRRLESINRRGRFYQGICLAKLGEWGQASDRFVAYVAAQPSDPTGWYWLSRTQLFRRQFSEASTSIERAIHLAPNSYEAFRTKGEIQLELRNNQAAYEAWIAANKLNPGDAQTTYYLGRLFMRRLREGSSVLAPEYATSDSDTLQCDDVPGTLHRTV